MTTERCRYVLTHFRELWELAHWPVSSNWLQKVHASRHQHTPASGLHNLALDLFTIERAIAVLPQREAAILMMHRWSQVDILEIANALRCSTSTVRAVLSRADNQVADICTAP